MEFLKNLAIPSVSFPPTTLSSRVERSGIEGSWHYRICTVLR